MQKYVYRGSPRLQGKWLTHLSLPSIHYAIVREQGIDLRQVSADGLGPVPRSTGGRGEGSLECD